MAMDLSEELDVNRRFKNLLLLVDEERDGPPLTVRRSP